MQRFLALSLLKKCISDSFIFVIHTRNSLFILKMIKTLTLRMWQWLMTKYFQLCWIEMARQIKMVITSLEMYQIFFPSFAFKSASDIIQMCRAAIVSWIKNIEMIQVIATCLLSRYHSIGLFDTKRMPVEIGWIIKSFFKSVKRSRQNTSVHDSRCDEQSDWKSYYLCVVQTSRHNCCRNESRTRLCSIVTAFTEKSLVCLYQSHTYEIGHKDQITFRRNDFAHRIAVVT